MPERKKIGSVNVITDCDTGMYHLGEVEAGFDEVELQKHVERYGIEELTKQLAFMQFQVWQMLKKVNSEKPQDDLVAS